MMKITVFEILNEIKFKRLTQAFLSEKAEGERTEGGAPNYPLLVKDPG